jgi:broad specificity phosphatase PhoE
MHKIMIIRHAEKHQHGIHDRGVTADGRPAHHELTVRGWQRAGALVSFFAPHNALPKDSPIQTPRSIFASNATKQSPSLRAMHTAGPLAAALGIAVNHDYAEDQEPALAAVVTSAPSPVLIVWHHGKSNVPAIGRMSDSTLSGSWKASRRMAAAGASRNARNACCRTIALTCHSVTWSYSSPCSIAIGTRVEHQDEGSS